MLLFSKTSTVTPTFYFTKFNENNSFNKWEKHWQKSMVTLLVNEINATERDIPGPTEQVQIVWLWVEIMCPLRDKIMQGIWRHFSGMQMNKQSKKVELVVIINTPHWKIITLICCARRSPKVTLITIFVSIVAWKQGRWFPLFITFLISPCPVTTAY